MMEIKNNLKKTITSRSESNSEYLWIIVASMPLLFQLIPSNVPVWAIGLVFGGWIANKHTLRWIALAWIVFVFFPSMPFLLLACSGVLLRNWWSCIYAALLGSVLCLVPIPGEFKNMGMVLIVVGLISIIYKKIK